jgi:uncharacterized membrane protein
MKGNIGQHDQVVRGVVGALLILLAGLGAVGGVVKVLAVVLGSIGVFTAASGFCPLYRAVGLNTYRA